MGRSCTGKDTIYNKLIADKSLNLKSAVLHATRPKRNKETDGVTYHFIDETKWNEMVQRNEFVETREYDTVEGVWKYSTYLCML